MCLECVWPCTAGCNKNMTSTLHSYVLITGLLTNQTGIKHGPLYSHACLIQELLCPLSLPVSNLQLYIKDLPKRSSPKMSSLSSQSQFILNELSQRSDSAHLVHAQVKHFDVSIVIACQHAPLVIIITVPKCYRPGTAASREGISHIHPLRMIIIASQPERPLPAMAQVET